MRVVFIDRDGTMGGAHTVVYPQDYRPFATTKDAFALLRAHGFSPMVFTNQACIARGTDGGYDFAAEFAEMGAVDWFVCPHDAEDNCACRKPRSGLLYEAQQQYGLVLSDCYVIGDRWSDMVAGGAAGCRLILVQTGRGTEALHEDRHKWAAYQPEYVAKDLWDAACFLCRTDTPL